MVIEQLFYQVTPPEFAKDFLQADADVWNPWLQRQPGFINKTSSHQANGKVSFMLFWKSREDLNKAAAKKKEIAALEGYMRERSPGQARLTLSLVT